MVGDGDGDINRPFVVAPEEKAELLCTFAALLLHDEGVCIASRSTTITTTAHVNVNGSLIAIADFMYS